MKRILIAVAIGILTFGSLAGCGSDDSGASSYCKDVCDNFNNCSFGFDFDYDGCLNICKTNESRYSDECKNCRFVTDCIMGWSCVTTYCEGF